MMNNMKLPPGVMPQDRADNIPAKLSPGEYVVPADVVRRMGTDALDKLVEKGRQQNAEAQQNGRIGGTPPVPQNPTAQPPQQQQQQAAPRPQQPQQPRPPMMQQQRPPMMQQQRPPMMQQPTPQAQNMQMPPQGFANGGQVTYPQGYMSYQNPGPYQFFPTTLGIMGPGGYPMPHVNPNFYDYTARRNTQTKKEDEVEGKKAADLRPGETEDGKMVGTNTDYDVAIANMKNQGGMGDHDNPDTMDYGDIPAATAVDMAVNGFNTATMQDEFGLTDAQKEHVESQVNDKGIVGPNGNVAGATDVPGTIANTLGQMAKGFMDWSRDPSEGNAPSRSRGNAPKGVPDKEKDVSLDEFGGSGGGISSGSGGGRGGNSTDTGGMEGVSGNDTDAPGGTGSVGPGGEQQSGPGHFANGGLVVPPAVQAFRRK